MRRTGIVLVVIIFSMLVTPYAFAIDQLICNSASKITLYPNGTLRSCMLKDPYEAYDIKCKVGPISFYEDGTLEECMLADKATVGGVTCSELSSISFYPSGKLKSCVIVK
jgi:hypothetical protein